MVYYQTPRPRAPIASAILSEELIARIMRQPDRGLSQLSYSSTPATEVAGFLAPPRLTIRRKEAGVIIREFHMVRVSGTLDGFVSFRGKPGVRWEDPTWEQIERTYLALDGESLAALERYVQELCAELGIPLDATEPEPTAGKLRSLPAAEPDLEGLIEFCELLGAESSHPEVSELLELARDPRRFVETRELLARMLPDECREFTWRTRFVSALGSAGVLAHLDWKADRDEVAAAIRSLDRTARLDDPLPARQGDMLFEFLETARSALMSQAKSLVMLGETGDSIAFTLVPAEREPRLLALAASLGLEPYPAPPKKPG